MLEYLKEGYPCHTDSSETSGVWSRKAVAVSDPQVAETDRFREIVAKLRSGDESSLDDILREVMPFLAARLARQFSPVLTMEDIDDVLAQTLYRVWTHREDYRAERAPFPMWCYVIARNIALDEVRNRAKQRAALSTLWDSLSRNQLPSQPARRDAVLDAFWPAFTKLSPVDRRILLASVSGEKAWAKQLTCELGLQSNAVRQRLFRAKKALRKEMPRFPVSQHGNPGPLPRGAGPAPFPRE